MSGPPVVTLERGRERSDPPRKGTDHAVGRAGLCYFQFGLGLISNLVARVRIPQRYPGTWVETIIG